MYVWEGDLSGGGQKSYSKWEEELSWGSCCPGAGVQRVSCPGLDVRSPSSVLHTVAHIGLIKDLSPRDRITPTLKQLHWFPIHARIAFKISLLMYHVHSGTSPSYMSSMVTPCSASRSRGLRSSTCGDFAVIRTNLKFGNRAFSVAGPIENGTAFLFQFANAHLLPNLSQN